jgi:hypothetical protein
VSLCLLRDAQAVAAQAATLATPASCPALSPQTVGAVLSLGAGLTGTALEAASSAPNAVFCWQPQLPTAPYVLAAAAANATAYPNATALFAMANSSAGASAVGSVCWLGCAATATAGAAAEAALLSSPAVPTTADSMLLGPSLFLCDADGSWAPAIAFERGAPAAVLSAKALRSQASASAVTVDCALKLRQLRSRPLNATAENGAIAGASASATISASATPFTAPDAPLPPPRCYGAAPAAPPAVLEAQSCGRYAFLRWSLTEPPGWASAPLSALLQRFLLVAPPSPRTWAAGSAEAAAQVASMDSVAATPALSYRTVLAAAVPYTAAAASGVAAAAFGGSSLSSAAALAVRGIQLPAAAALSDAGGAVAPLAAGGQLPLLVGAVVAGTVPETASLRADGSAGLAWDHAAALTRLSDQLIAAYGSSVSVFGAAVTVSAVVNIVGPSRDGTALNATAAIPLRFGGSAVANAIDATSSCSFATTSVAHPPTVLPDTRYSELLATPGAVVDAITATTPTPSPAPAAAVASAVPRSGRSCGR